MTWQCWKYLHMGLYFFRRGIYRDSTCPSRSRVPYAPLSSRFCILHTNSFTEESVVSVVKIAGKPAFTACCCSMKLSSHGELLLYTQSTLCGELCFSRPIEYILNRTFKTGTFNRSDTHPNCFFTARVPFFSPPTLTRRWKPSKGKGGKIIPWPQPSLPTMVVHVAINDFTGRIRKVFGWFTFIF